MPDCPLVTQSWVIAHPVQEADISHVCSFASRIPSPSFLRLFLTLLNNGDRYNRGRCKGESRTTGGRTLEPLGRSTRGDNESFLNSLFSIRGITVEPRLALPQPSDRVTADVCERHPPIASVLREERLPLTVRIVSSAAELDKAVCIRHSAYGRHVPDLAARLKDPEAYDLEEGSVVLLAESKLDGSPMGTMRISTNRFRKLALEDSIQLPAWLGGKSQAEATRLGVESGSMGRIAKIALFKAYYEYCALNDIEWMVITARSPLDKQYRALLFTDVFHRYIPMQHVGMIPHRVLAFHVPSAEENWIAGDHPLLGFVFRTRHPDIDIARPRRFVPSNKVSSLELPN